MSHTIRSRCRSNGTNSRRPSSSSCRITSSVSSATITEQLLNRIKLIQLLSIKRNYASARSPVVQRLRSNQQRRRILINWCSCGLIVTLSRRRSVSVTLSAAMMNVLTMQQCDDESSFVIAHRLVEKAGRRDAVRVQAGCCVERLQSRRSECFSNSVLMAPVSNCVIA